MTELERKLREDICEVARRMYNAGFMAGSDGNLSAILGDNEILITPSRLCKGFLRPEDIVKIDKLGNQLEGDLPVTTEKAVHLAAYEERPDICAVAHTHPPILVAFTVAGLNLPHSILPEIEMLFGGRVPLGYYKDPDKTERTFLEIDGQRYSCPGDYATVDADGKITLLGRGSVCINTGGEKVFPEEVEEALKRHPTVLDAVVVGVPDDKFGEAVTGVVELYDGATLDEAALIAEVRTTLAGYKAPKRILAVATIGRAANGKVDYKRIKADATAALAS